MVLSITAKEKHFENNILNSPDWIKNRSKAKIKSGKGRQPHKRNRILLTISDDIFKQEILRKGVLAYSRELNCSQSSIRERAWKLEIVLKSGPRPAMTETSEYRAQALKQRMEQHLPTHSTSIEIAIWDELDRRSIPFEKHKTVLNLTQPDAFIEPNICIYSDGDYWHNLPKNKNQDQYVNEGLRRAGYRVFRFWEYEIKKDVKSCIDKIN